MDRHTIRTIIKWILICGALLLIGGYTIYSSKNLVRGPRIVIAEPLDGSLYSTTTVTIIGQAFNIQKISLNDKPILIDEEGNFKEVTLLYPGYNVLTMTASDRFGRSTEQLLHLIAIIQ
jgi:hypothetical protein